jgi:hypothetical protein
VYARQQSKTKARERSGAILRPKGAEGGYRRSSWVSEPARERRKVRSATCKRWVTARATAQLLAARVCQKY